MDQKQIWRSCFVGLATLAFGSFLSGTLVYFLICSSGSGKIEKSSSAVPRKNQRQKKKSRKGRFPGLYNLGTTCFANSLLQGLASCRSVLQWLERLGESEEFEQMYFLPELLRIIRGLNFSESNYDSAEGVLNALRRHGWVVDSHIEQDLFELLNVFVSTWDEELQRLEKKECSSLLQFKDIEENVDSCLLGALTDRLSRESSHRSPFSGLAGTQFQCRRCLTKRVRHDRFTALSLVIPKSTQQTVTLENCLKKYFAIEVVTDAKCEHCEKLSNNNNNRDTKSELIKKQGISKFPPCLIFRIERRGMLGSGVVFKHYDHVEFPEILDLRDFAFYRSKFEEYMGSGDGLGVKGGKLESTHQPNISSLASTVCAQCFHMGLQQNALISGGSHLNSNFLRSLKYRYKLCGVSVHMGTAESGHFVTYRRRSGKNYSQWFYTSDCTVEEVSYAEVKNSEAYMLYYEKIAKY